LANFAILGWFIGQSRAGIAFFTQLFLNITNMVLSAVFVLHFGMATDGVGLAVVVSEYAAVVLGLILALRALGTLQEARSWARVFERAQFTKLVAANTDIMIRTFCLVFAFGWFASRGAKSGDTVIAANSVLLLLFDVAAYLIDGFAYASEALVGQAIGARDRPRFTQAVRLTTLWAMVIGTLCSLVIWFAGLPLISLMTTNSEIIGIAMIYLPWAALTPVLGTICFQFDGIFTGAMATKDMRNMMVLSLVIYLGSWWWLEPRFGNHGLWAALCIFFVARGITYATRMPALTRRAFAYAD
jgi:multidrug resistance protein, MATE family